MKNRLNNDAPLHADAEDPAPSADPMNPKVGWFDGLIKRNEDQTFCLLFTFLVSVTVAFTLSLIMMPLPRIHDEFAYLMAGDGLAQMKTAAETHPHWEHFESFHIIHHPTYASKYPPGQAVTLAAGQRLGHPVIGACLATACSLTAVMWMLMGWLPRRTNFFVSLLLATHPGIQIVWGQSFMGGAVAMTGGALLLGAFVRLTRPFSIRYAILAAIGISLLVITRPMEGAVLTTGVLIALLVQLVRNPDWKVGPFLSRVVAPAAVVGGLAGAAFLSYNTSITGHPLTLPYQVHEQTYGWNPLFLFQKPSENPPEYQHRVIERFYHHDVAQTNQQFGTVNDFVRTKASVAMDLEYFFFGCSLVYGLLGIPFVVQQKRYRWAILLIVPVVIAGFITPWGHSHYLAPITPMILLLVFAGLTEIWQKANQASVLRWLAVLVVAMHAVWFASNFRAYRLSQIDAWQSKRQAIQTKLESSPGLDLVFVRYADEAHNCHEEWVYNRFDIDRAEVVWAREMEPTKNMELIEYFSNRRVWLVQPDNDPEQLFAYRAIQDSRPSEKQKP